MSSFVIRLAFVLLVMMAGSSTAFAQPALPTGAPQKASIAPDKPAEYTLAAKTAGVLMVAVHGDGDLALAVTDVDGQVLPDGSVDRDMNGDSGLELVSVLIPEPGTYRVRVRLQGGSAGSLQISSSWLSFPAFARANTDADSKPSGAQRLQLGKPHEDSLDSATGDVWDWFSFQATEAGTMVIVTRRLGEGDTDLTLATFVDGKFGEPVERSDQDLQGDKANESVTVSVTAGQTVYVKVSSAFTRTTGKYRISSSLIP